MSAPDAERQYVESYGAGRFRVAGVVWQGSVLVFPERTVAWPVASFAAVDAATLAPALDAAPEILLLGCGARQLLPDAALRDACRDAGVALETMDTGAACRTYNILAGEDRRVAAALIAVAAAA